MRQGGVISPLLLIIYKDRCLENVAAEHGDNAITMVYADDVAVITNSEK